jgi:hypothetical protein
MAGFTVTNKCVDYFLATALTVAPDIRMILFKGTFPAVATLKDIDNVTAAIATTLDECDATNYSPGPTTRHTGNGSVLDPTITWGPIDAANDRFRITAAAPVFTALGGATNNTLVCVGWYIHTGTNDTNNIMLGFDQPASGNLTTSGQNVTFPALQLDITGTTGT